MVLDFEQITKEDVNTAGGKGANLGEMTQAGIAVPEGFVVAVEGYQSFMLENGLEKMVEQELKEAGNDESKLLEAAARIRTFIQKGRLPERLVKEVTREYLKLGGDARVAVRSSATAEDLPDASFAGQQETYLNVYGVEQVLEKIKSCYASLWGNRAVCYRRNQSYDQSTVALAVVIQRMVESEKAGVLFTANPVTHNLDEIQINASYGLGESIVSGKVTADSYLCDKNGNILSFQMGAKETEILYGKENTVEVNVEESRRNKQCLTSEEVQKLCKEARKVEQHYGHPMDIEWGIQNGNIYILQARAITTLEKNNDEEKLIAKYLEGCKISGMMKKNMSFMLEKMPFAYRALDYDYLALIDDQKANIFAENGIIVNLNPKIDEDGIQVLPDSSKKINGNVIHLFKTLKELKNYDLCAEKCHHFMEQYEKDINKMKNLDYPNMSIEECGKFLSYSSEWIEKLAYDRFRYALFPTFLSKDLVRAVQKVNPKYTSYDLYWGLDNKTSVVAEDVSGLADWVKNHGEVKSALLAGMKYKELSDRFPEFKEKVEVFLSQNGYKSDYNCYCMIARTFLEDPDRLMNIIRPLLTEQITISAGNEKDFHILMQSLKEIYGSKFSKLEKKINQFRYFHVVREESQYLWETCFYYVRRCLERTNELLFGNTDYISGVANLFLKELLDVCERGSLSGSDRDKIKRRNDKHPLALKVWNAAKLLVFDTNGDVLKGVSGSSGVAVGRVCIIHGPEEFHKMQKGDILVCHLTDPEWTPLFQLASAVVADTGAALSHAAIVAREYGIPAVLGVGYATTKYHDGDTIRVDGDKGEVSCC